jgi:hypothetical protein
LDLGRAGHVTRAYNHWKHKLIRAILILQSFHITDCDFDLLAGKDVCDRLREDVWAFLIEQSRDFAARLRGFVNCLRLFTRKNFPAYRTLADDHRHIVDGRVLRQGKRVNRLDLFFKGIFELLRYYDARKEAADFDFDVGVL